MILLLALLPITALATTPVLTPNGTYVQGPITLTPNGTYVTGTPILTPNGTYIGTTTGTTYESTQTNPSSSREQPLPPFSTNPR